MAALRRLHPLRPRVPRGFTLLELIAANVIAVIILGSVTVALRMVNRSQQQARSAAAAVNPAREGIVSLLRNDLANSRRMWQYPDGSGVVLSGYAGLSSATMQPTGELCRVYYRVANGVLVRVQEPIDGPAGRRNWSEMVCPGVTKFVLVPVPDREELPAQDDDPRAGVRLSGRVTLTIQSRDPAHSISEELWLR